MKKAKKDFENFFFKLMNNAAFGKTMGNMRKHRDIMLVTVKPTRNYLVSHTHTHTHFFSEYLLAIEMKKKKQNKTKQNKKKTKKKNKYF